MNSRQLKRCLQLLNVLEAGMGHTVHELAQECQVSKRTIYRDFHLLAEAGVHLRYEASAGGHVAFSQYPSAVLRGFTREELTTLALAARTSCLLPVATVRSSVNQSISKILARISPQKREGIVQLLKSCLVDLPHLDVDQQVFSVISSAIRENRQIRITFIPCEQDGCPLRTKVAPYRLVASSESWELIGRSSLHRRVCRFNLSQIRTVELAEDPIPPQDTRFRHGRPKTVFIPGGPVRHHPDGLSLSPPAAAGGDTLDH